MMFFRRLFRRTREEAGGNDAFAVAVKLIERNPREETLYINLLAVCEQQGDLHRAIAYLNKLAQRKRRIDNPYRYLLAAYRRDDDFEGLRRAIWKDRTHHAAHEWFLSDAYVKSDWDGAIVLLTVLVEAQPGEEKWRRYLSTARAMKGSRPATFERKTKSIDGDSVRDTDTARCGTRGAPASTAADWQPSTSRRKTEFDTKVEMETKLHERRGQQRREQRMADAARFWPRRALTSREKFNSIKPTGQRDSYSDR